MALGSVDDDRTSNLDLPPWLRPFAGVVAMVAVMWVVEIVDLLPRTDFDRWGIQPREVDGLVGIAAAPFLHGGFGHLVGNTIPFLVLGFMIAASGARRLAVVVLIVALSSGIGTWLTGPDDTVHIGASGLVFGFITYLLARGFFDRKIRYLLVGAIVLVLYGSALIGVLPSDYGISWQGHLFGAIGGVVAARVVHGTDRVARSDEDGLL